MVRLAVLSSWAELQIQSTQRPYLVNIVAPHISTLIPMWLETLTAYAKLQFEPDAGDGMVIEEMIADSQYNHASKEFLLQVKIPHDPSLMERSTIPAGSRSYMLLRPLLNSRVNTFSRLLMSNERAVQLLSCWPITEMNLSLSSL